MDIFNDHSDSVESQPTQLLQHALTKQKSTVEHIDDNWGETGGISAQPFLANSMIVPPAQGSTPRYQFNWLAPTQTQPQVLHREEEIVKEGSQKENTPASSEIKHEIAARTRSSSPQASSAKPVNLKGSHADSLSHPDSRTASGIGKANVPKSVSFQSPRPARLAQPLLQPTKSLPAAPGRRQRSPSPPSQDSFGGAVSQDPAATYMAQATQVFEVPLSDLGHTTANDLTMDDPLAHSSKSQEEEGDSWMDKIRRAYEQTKTSEASGSILVAGTPSQSSGEGSSQNVSFPHPDASQLLNDEDSLESIGARRNRYGVEADASQSSLIVAEDEPTEDTKPAAIPGQFEPTQLSTPMENTVISTLAEDYARTLGSRSARATVGTTSTPGPRSLLSLIRPEQRERRLRQLYGNGPSAPPPPASDNAAMQPFNQTPYEHAQTQPSSFVATPTSDLLSEDNDMPPPIRQPPSLRHLQLSQPQEADNLDIVPDSEPPVPSTATPTRDARFNQSPTKRPFRPLSPMSEHGSGEIVADSMEVSESSQDPEGDIPLAALLQQNRLREKRDPRGGHHLPPPPPVLVKKSNPQVNPPTIKPKSSTRGKKNAKQEYGEIPTSAPEQDLQDRTSMPGRVPTPTVVPPSVKNKKQKGKAPPAPTRKSSRNRAASSAAGKKRKHSSDTEASDEGETHPTPKAEKQEEEETELTDNEDYMDVGPAPAELKAPSSWKRRRVEDVKPARAPSKASTRSKTSDTPAPPTRAANRLRPAVSTSRALPAQPATRVFALWRQDGHYYSGTVHSLLTGTRYLIKFDDETEDQVDITMLRRYELRVGDAMESGSVHVEVDDGSDTESSNYEILDIRIASRVVQSHWKDRTLTADSIVTIIRPKPLHATPSPSGMSLMSATSVKQKKPFAKTGFVVTLTVRNKHPEQMKDSVMLAIKHNGGTVIDDWSSIFPMEGSHSQSNKRWIASRENFKFNPKPEFEGLERVFLLADDYNQKPKFLEALALGIPCLSHEWMRDDYLKHQISPDWQPFLLPAGFSESLSARVSQLVDLDWGNCKEHLIDIMSNTVASKLFSGKTILCIGADFVPLPPRGGRKGGFDATQDASRIVPWIMICMGASQVEAVTEVKVASKELLAYDHVVVKESTERPKDIQDDVTLADVPWVKDCLISGRLLQTPASR
ncbi:uncharacterized protein EDB91DRAFT_1093869 [Suillus paluster]|uniref:uncharacterized protein n=1 Tax=Suillus paluster TaxID=48578 RepID=UPI001B8843FD|nr:uncharacterized protein EDB91DRAFT_1093869 [Suillus paluster]KAG1756675.1 hypothetical protein EDB91DRAFT_1093869 [Suillus paluster]